MSTEAEDLRRHIGAHVGEIAADTVLDMLREAAPEVLAELVGWETVGYEWDTGPGPRRRGINTERIDHPSERPVFAPPRRTS